jgi:predicted RNA methylase
MTPTSEVTQKTGLDKFYTIPSISEKCISIVGRLYNWSEWDLVIEPSAGNGSFLTQLPTQNRIGIDIAPEHDAILEQDFFTYRPPLTKKKVLVIGNPPFGRVSSLAIRFFNHAAEWASVIAFILPRTFRRISVQKKLNRYFHIEYDEDIPTTPCSFHPPMMAKCCFQIWSKKETMRPLIELPVSHTDWEFLALGPKDSNGQPTPPQGADFAIRAYGGKCGEIVKEGLESLRPKSWHWIRSTIDTETLLKRFESLDYSLSLDTARQNSIGKGELVMLYSDSYD